MSLPKLPLFLALFGVASAAHAQNTTTSVVPNQTYTTVDSFGNVVRNMSPVAAVPTLGNQRQKLTQQNMTGVQGRIDNLNNSVVNGANNNVVASDRNRRGRDRDRGDSVRYGGGYYAPGYVPSVPYYPYPAPAYNNNYYYPALPSTTVLGAPHYSWSHPVTITNIPLGNTYGGYPAPGYGYPAYPAPGYGYAQSGYGYPQPAYGYPTYPYPAYGTTTTIVGAGNGSIFSQSQNSGYGVALGRGGVSVQIGGGRSNSTTTYSRY